jgi:lipopolysaccharide/colanic/teichoic acid biosynthesis glycosyltransferase
LRGILQPFSPSLDNTSKNGRWALKRGTDLVASTLLLVSLAPLMLLVAVLVRLSSPGPIFFRQKRVGLGGRVFSMLKFRTMWVDQSRLVDSHYIASMQAMGILVKMRDDPRITPLGRLLRRTSLDEIPQLFNVLRGDMSLVGPRPLPPFMLNADPELVQERSAVKPGMTGLWQVKARHKNTSVMDMIEFDLKYVREYSLWMDLKILAATIPAVLHSGGA